MVIGIFGESCVGKSTLAKRMGGNLPAPVAGMLERKHGMFDNEPKDVHIVSGEAEPDAACEQIARLLTA